MNFFEIASKEADQDNFISWLLKSYNSQCDLEKNASYAFINELAEHKFVDIVNVIEKKSKIGNGIPDFTIGIEEKEQCFVILIEDKVNASINNDLSSYKSNLEKDIDNVCNQLFRKRVDNPILKFVLIKTGHVSEQEKKTVEAKGFRLIDSKKLESILSDFCSHYLISSFVEKISMKKNKLFDYSRTEEELYDEIANELNTKCKIINKKKVLFLLDDLESYIQMEIICLISGDIKLRACSKRSDFILNKELWKIVKNSKANVPVKGRRDLTIGNCSLNELIEELNKYFTDANKCFKR